jgi:alpha-tubulin suppressor-like RCC1 family protein
MPNQFNSPEGDLENYFATEYWLIDQYVGDTLWGWGYGAFFGLLADNIGAHRSTPITTFAGGTNWKSISAGGLHAAAIKTDGTLWTWGAGSLGRLGTNDATNRFTPVTTFAGGTNWKQVSNSSTAVHNAAIKTDGTLWIWGLNDSRLGNNTTSNRSTPVTTFSGGTNWKQVATGYRTTTAIKTDGTLWIWGNNSYQALGVNDNSNRPTPVTTFAGGTNWKQVACGRDFSSAIKTDGTLWTWGQNNYGQLGDNTTTNRLTPVTTLVGGTNWKQVACGSFHTTAIKTDGTLWTWGRNSYGQLGINLAGTTNGRSTPVTTFSGGTNWKQVACGYWQVISLKTDGTLWVWGRNLEGQMGTNDTNNRSTPVTTFAGGTNWKQVAGASAIYAVTSGTDPTFFIT